MQKGQKPDKGGYQSGQMGQTVNLLAYAFGGSNPSPPTKKDAFRKHPFIFISGFISTGPFYKIMEVSTLPVFFEKPNPILKSLRLSDVKGA